MENQVENKKESKKKIILKEYHTKEYLNKLSKGNNVIFVLPNNTEIEVNGKVGIQNDNKG